MSTTRTTDLSFSRPSRTFNVAGFFWTLAALRRQRRDLAKLDASRLHDIGVSAFEARREAARPAWDVPQNWRR